MYICGSVHATLPVWGGGWGGGAGRYGSEPPSPTVWRREPEAAPDTLLPGPGLPLPVDLEPACPEEAGRMHTGQTGTETSRVNWAEGASSRLNLATPFPSGSLGTPSSFQLSADSQCAGVWRGPESGWAHPGSWPPAAGQPEPIGFSVSISALGSERERGRSVRKSWGFPPTTLRREGRDPQIPSSPPWGPGVSSGCCRSSPLEGGAKARADIRGMTAKHGEQRECN